MRSRSRVRSLFVPLAIVGVLGAAASPAPARTRRHPRHGRRRHRGTSRHRSTAPEARRKAAARAGAGSGADSGIEGADLAGTDGSIISVETSGSPEADANVAALNEFAEANGMTINLRRHRDVRGRHRTRRWRRERRPTSPCSRSRAASPRSREPATSFRCPTTSSPASSENWPDGWMSFGNVDGTQYGVPIKSDLKSLVWYMPASFAEKGYEVPDDARRLLRPHRADDRQRRHAAVRRHRGRGGDRLAVHRLGGGAGPARTGHRLLQPVGGPRDPVQLARDRRHDAAGHRLLEHRGDGRTPPAGRSSPRRWATTASRWSTATA